MSSADGTWNIEIATPMGVQRFTLELTTAGESLSGTATNNSGELEIRDGVVEGDTLSFSIDVTSPFPLALAFRLTVNGDSIGGDSVAGPFPPSAVTGRRAIVA